MLRAYGVIYSESCSVNVAFPPLLFVVVSILSRALVLPYCFSFVIGSNGSQVLLFWLVR